MSEPSSPTSKEQYESVNVVKQKFQPDPVANCEAFLPDPVANCRHRAEACIRIRERTRADVCGATGSRSSAAGRLTPSNGGSKLKSPRSSGTNTVKRFSL